MNYTFMKEATEYVNSLPRITDMNDASLYSGDVLLLPSDVEINVLTNSNVVLSGLDKSKDNKAKDLLRVIQVIDALNLEYVETNVLVPSLYAHSLEIKPWHITTQAFLTTKYTDALGKFIDDEKKKRRDYYGKHPMDYFWLPCGKTTSELHTNDVICIFNRRISGWDGSLDRPVIELLGAGGHLQSVWEPQKEQFVSRSVISNLQKEFSEEIGIKLTAKDVNIIGGFINTKTYELVILANIIISPELVPHIQEYAIGNFEEDTDGIYLGSFEETMNSYMIDASYFAGGNAAAITNFPYNDDIMIRFRKQFMSIPPAESHLHRV